MKKLIIFAALIFFSFEATAQCEPITCEEAFTLMDADQSGDIDILEFYAVVTSGGLFSTLDVDGSGTLTEAEVCLVEWELC